MTGAARRGVGLAGGLALALAAAAGLGVALGRSAIAEINPIHYRDPEPVRAVRPEPAPPPRDDFAQAYGWDRGASARAEVCGADCDGRAALRLTYEGSPPRADTSGWSDEIVPADPAPWRPGEIGPEDRRIDEHAQHPIEEKPAATMPAEAPPARAASAAGD